MALNGNSPGSSLSSLSSEDFAEDLRAEDDVETIQDIDSSLRQQAHRSAKRQKVGSGWDIRHQSPEYLEDIDTELSSDTEGSVPGSPTHPTQVAQDEEALGHEQISECQWEGCQAGELGNMDNLVDHIHDEHIGQRQKKYSCEWISCPRKGISHASGYALRAHMRSHTREKPFYCSLPALNKMIECDRAFTRSDALAKHMRTVHETEALRPSDPVPKHHSSFPANKLQRVRLVFNSSATKSGKTSPLLASSTFDTEMTHNANAEDGSLVSLRLDDSKQFGQESRAGTNNGDYALYNRRLSYPSDMLLTASEANLPPDQLFRILQLQKAWSDMETAKLKREMAELEAKCQEEWLAKELILENAMEAEFAVESRRFSRISHESKDGREKILIRNKMLDDVKPAMKLNIRGEAPWWRIIEKSQADIDYGLSNDIRNDEAPLSGN